MRCRELREHLRGHLAPGNRVLILGCGNSTLAEDLYCDSLGVSDIVSVDISPTVIQNMGAQAAQRGHHELKWQVRQSCNHQKSISSPQHPSGVGLPPRSHLVRLVLLPCWLTTQRIAWSPASDGRLVWQCLVVSMAKSAECPPH